MSGTAGPAIARFIGKTVGDDSLLGLSLSSGAQILGVIIDNFSGSWLYIPQTQQYVPPFTAGWASIVSPPNATLDFVYQTGPIGLASTNSGSPAVVQLFGAPVQNSPGVAVTAATPVEAPSALTVTAKPQGSAGSVITLISGVASSRIRLVQLAMAYNYEAANVASFNFDTPTTLGPFYADPVIGNVSMPFLSIGPTAPFAESHFGVVGFDLPLGIALQAQINSLWANTLVTISWISAYV